MKKFAKFAVLLALCAALLAVGYHIFQIRPDSDVVIFRIVRIWFLPLPLPLGLFTSPHFWGVVVMLLGVAVGASAVKALGRD